MLASIFQPYIHTNPQQLHIFQPILQPYIQPITNNYTYSNILSSLE